METTKQTNKRNVRSKYRAEYTGDFVFDYKDSTTLYRFIAEGGKILPARLSKLSYAQQKKVAAAVKKARTLALLPLGNYAYDFYERPEALSPKPFSLD